MSTILLIALVAALVSLCWFLHIITWPLVQLARSATAFRVLSFVTASAAGSLGVLFANDVGLPHWGRVGYIVLVFPGVYFAFLCVLLYWTMNVLAGLALCPRGPRKNRFRFEWVQSVADTMPRTRLILILLLVAVSALMIGLDIYSGYQGWSLVTSLIVAYFTFTIADLGRSVRWYVKHGPDVVDLCERRRLPDDDLASVQPLHNRIQHAVWGP